MSARSPQQPRAFLWKGLLFLLVAAVGLYYVKWSPYYLKSFTAAETHSIGASILAHAPDGPVLAALAYAKAYFLAIWKAAVLAVILGSLLQVLIPRHWVLRLFGGSGLGSTMRGGLFALPGMMCSCCAAPVAVALRRQQASAGAALAFWIANPVLNPAALLFMGFVLGWEFSALRLVFGLFLVIGVGLLAQRMAGDEPMQDAFAREATVEAQAQDQGGFALRWLRQAWHLFWSTAPVYVVTVLLLGAARVWLFPQAGDALGDSMFWLLPLAVIGTLFVIPTAAEIPIVQTMMASGLGMASAVALLVTLPAVSLPSLLMLRQAFAARLLVAVAVLTTAVGSLAGLTAWLFL